MTLNPRQRRIDAEAAVLAVLACHGPLSAYPLTRHARMRSARVMPAVDRLIERGWVKDYWEDDIDLGSPFRRYYALVNRCA